MYTLLRDGLILVSAASIATCTTGMEVRTDYDPQASFSMLHSYEWLDSAEVADELGSPFLERRLRRAVDAALEQRGFVLASGADVDFHVTAFVVAPQSNHGTECLGPCLRPSASVFVGFGYPHAYPYAYPFGYPWYRMGHPYWRSPWGYAHAYRVGFGYTWFPVYDQPSSRLSGTVIIDVFDAARGTLLWRGWAEGELSELLDPNTPTAQAEVNAVVADILATFPPGTG